MSFMNALKGAIWEGGDASQAAQPAPQKQAGVQPISFSPSANNEYVEVLRSAIKSRSSAFTALLIAAEKLTAIIPDPGTRLKAAFATVSGEGRGVREVMAAIEIHASDLETQRALFSQALEKQKAAALGGLEAEQAAVTASSAGAQQQMAQMQQQINTLSALLGTNSQKLAEIQAKTASETVKFSTSAQQFDTALSLVKGELDGQKSVIQSALA